MQEHDAVAASVKENRLKLKQAKANASREAQEAYVSRMLDTLKDDDTAKILELRRNFETTCEWFILIYNT